jgi:cell division septation protein DedD
MALNEADDVPAPGAPPVAALPSGPAPAAPDQFALQVAAYLRQDYALKLVDDLKKKGLKAYWIETASSGKTWYQVRIAPFPDPQSAREFGRDLKWRGVIDDFYVTSASR